MRELVRRLPQLHRLAVFDAVVQAGSFTAAATELQISQPAVSRHMASLNKELGFDVFERSGRSLTLTAKGRILADSVDSSFTGLERALSEADSQSTVFVLAVQPALATSWIVPMLDQLELATQAEIRLRVFEQRAELRDNAWDLAIVPGLGEWDEWESTMLFGEAVRPFASPALAAELGLDESSLPIELIGRNILHHQAASRPSMTWAEWFENAGETTPLPEPRVVYNSAATVMQEAIAGNGIALGWQHLVSDMVERGLLMAVGPVVKRKHGGHHLCWHARRGDERHLAARDLLQAEIMATPNW